MSASVTTWRRHNHIGNLPKDSAGLVRNYADLVQNHESGAYLSDDAILERAQRIAAAASAEYNSSKKVESLINTAEYRCLETGGFLLPTVNKHPWYRSKDQRNKLLPSHVAINANDTAKMGNVRYCNNILDLGCGIAADGRQMLVDGFATNVVGVDRSELYLRLGCELFGDNPRETIVHPCNKDEGMDTAEANRGQSKIKLLPLNVIDKDDRCSFLAIISRALESQHRTSGTPHQTNFDDEDNYTIPFFDGVYAGKFLHCLETEENFRILLRLLRKVLVPGGVFFGVFGRTFSPVWECCLKDDFERVLVSEGFSVGMVLEEAAGATWFFSFNEPAS